MNVNIHATLVHTGLIKMTEYKIEITPSNKTFCFGSCAGRRIDKDEIRLTLTEFTKFVTRQYYCKRFGCAQRKLMESIDILQRLLKELEYNGNK